MIHAAPQPHAAQAPHAGARAARPFAVRIYGGVRGREISIIAKSSCEAAMRAIDMVSAEVEEIGARSGLKIVVEDMRRAA